MNKGKSSIIKMLNFKTKHVLVIGLIKYRFL